ncbi:MAG: GNAT family N-acetyltransferase [Planctomycetota bacterium]|nr:GNAT family N-acetyltransferase [Planctomycetota bacterium]
MRAIEIQRLRPDESERLRRIRLRSLAEAPDAFGSTLEETAARPPASWDAQLRNLPTFVATGPDGDVGIVRSAVDGEDPTHGWLISMWVDPAVRGRRIGERLIDAVIGWARERGLQRLQLDVGDGNGPAIALYARKGFEPTGETSALPPPREHLREHRRALGLRPDRGHS